MKNITCCFTGHRPNKLFGYDMKHESYQNLAKRVKRLAHYLHTEYGVINFISGGAIGFDTVAFFAIESLKKDYPGIKNIIAIPFIGQESKWKEDSIERYKKMLNLADDIIHVDQIEKYKASSVAGKLNKRNHYMVDNSSYLIACYDGTKGGTYNCLEYAVKTGLSHLYNTF